MIINKWSQGQLFSFSGMDGESYYNDDFVGILSGDRLGIRFFSLIIRELAVVNLEDLLLSFEAVTSDCISIKANDAENINIVYAKRHLIVGNTAFGSRAIVLVDGLYEKMICDNVEIHDTNDGEYTGLLIEGNKFSFAFGKSVEDVVEKCRSGMEINVENEIEKKLELYSRFSLSPENKYAALYSKCLSVMKSQIYSPEGMFKRNWSTPDRLPHKHLWLWDSVFHSIGHSNVNMSLAENLLLAVFDTQRDDGFIPHLSGTDFSSGITQPPVIAWGAYKLYTRNGNKEFLKEVFENNKRFLNWCRKNRRESEDELYTWNTQSDLNCRCDESGMDNSPRFDVQARLWAIDFSCFMANETRVMKKIAQELGDSASAEFFGEWFEEIKNAVNEKLWCEGAGFYFDYNTTDGEFNKVMSVASFLPLFSGVCDKERAVKLIEALTNPTLFYTNMPIASIAKTDATYGSDMWRGPVWINYNYIISEGLREYGYENIAEDIIDKTIEAVNKWYQQSGTFYEFYDSDNAVIPSQLNRKGTPFEPYNFRYRYQSIRDYGWTCTLVFDMLHNKYC